MPQTQQNGSEKPEQKKDKKKEKKEKKSAQKKKAKKQRMDQLRIEELEQAFSIFDKNGDGSITKIELGDVLNDADVHFTQDQLNQFMAKLDKDGDGTVDYQEFCNLMKEMVAKAVAMEKQIREAFDAIDTNGDGEISSAEIVASMAAQGRELSIEEADEIISNLDNDGNKTIGFDEFVLMMYTLSMDND